MFGIHSLSLLFICVFCLAMTTKLYSLEQSADDARPMSLKNSKQNLGSLTYGQFLHCLRTASFDDEEGRKINTKNNRLIVAQIEGRSWYIETREENESVSIENITIDTHHYATLTEQSRLLMHLFSHCHIPQEENAD